MSSALRTMDVTAIFQRPLFFDANILLYLFGAATTQQNSWAVNEYASLFKNCIQLGCRTFTDVIVLSEYINKFLRMEYEFYLNTNGLNKNTFTFKNFRSSPEGRTVSNDIELIVKGRILKKFTILGNNFNNQSIASISLADNDFNDLLIIETCKANNCVLVTNDADFSGYSVDILTRNRKLK